MGVFHVFKTAHMLQIAQHDLSCIQSLIDSHVRVFSSPCFTRSGFSSIRSFFSTNFFFLCFIFYFFKIFFSPLPVILDLGWASTFFKCRYIQQNTLFSPVVDGWYLLDPGLSRKCPVIQGLSVLPSVRKFSQD